MIQDFLPVAVFLLACGAAADSGSGQQSVATCAEQTASVTPPLIPCAGSLDRVEILRVIDPDQPFPDLASRPNGYTFISARLVNHFLQRKVDDHRTIRETIAGAFTVAPLDTSGAITAALIPDPSRILLEVRLNGQCIGNSSVSQKRSVTIYGSSYTSIDGRHQIAMDWNGVQSAGSYVSCVTNAVIHNIVAPRRFVERIAWRLAERSRSEAEYESARSAERRIAEQMRVEVAAMLTTANNVFVGRVRQPLEQRNATPQLRFRTTADGAEIAVLQATSAQPGASAGPPPFNTTNDLTVRMHESLFENIAETFLGDQQIKDECFLDLMKSLTGRPPRALWVHARTDPWFVVVQSQRPVRFKFADGRVHIALSITETGRGDKRYQIPLIISAAYEAVATRDGIMAKRSGDVQISAPDDGMQPDSDELISFLRRKFSGVFQEEIYFDGLVPPTGGTGNKLRDLAVDQIDFAGGWATLSYRLDTLSKGVTKTQLAGR